jgi:hypothetical protein
LEAILWEEQVFVTWQRGQPMASLLYSKAMNEPPPPLKNVILGRFQRTCSKKNFVNYFALVINNDLSRNRKPPQGRLLWDSFAAVWPTHKELPSKF